jgi:hypothetical protein
MFSRRSRNHQNSNDRNTTEELFGTLENCGMRLENSTDFGHCFEFRASDFEFTKNLTGYPFAVPKGL